MSRLMAKMFTLEVLMWNSPSRPRSRRLIRTEYSYAYDRAPAIYTIPRAHAYTCVWKAAGCPSPINPALDSAAQKHG